MIKKIIAYFNLNKRTSKFFLHSWKEMQQTRREMIASLEHQSSMHTPPENELINNETSASIALVSELAATTDEKMSIWEQLLMYLGILIGVFLSSTILIYHQTDQIIIDPNWQKLMVSSVTALIIMPLIYEKLAMIPNRSPLLVRLGLFVQNGVFWNVLLGTLFK